MGGLTAATAADVPESIIRMQTRPLTARVSQRYVRLTCADRYDRFINIDSYPGTAGPLHLLSVGTPARPVRACSPLPARILHGRRRHSNRTTTMAGPTKRPAACPSWPELAIGLVITWTVAANTTPTPALVSPMASH